MSFASQYEQILNGFDHKRTEMLKVVEKSSIRSKDVHTRKWRVKQIENAISDLKTAISACSIQISKERIVLDALDSECSRMQVQKKQLLSDVQLLEAVTGMKAVYPKDEEIETLKTINTITHEVDNVFAEFLSSMDIKKNECISFSLKKEAEYLTNSLREFVDLVYSTREAEVRLSRGIFEQSINVSEKQKLIEEDTITFDQKVLKMKREAEKQVQDKQESLKLKLNELKNEAKIINKEYETSVSNNAREMDELIEEKRRIKERCKSMKSFISSLKENMHNRVKSTQTEIDRFENRLSVIMRQPSKVDQRMVNYGMLISKNSKGLKKAISIMREEISEYNKKAFENLSF